MAMEACTPHTHSRPHGAPAMHQDWEDIVFLHWPVPVATLDPLLPDGLQIDTFEGQAYLGITPFLAENTRAAGLPALPYLSSYLECNVRTYVRGPDGSRGVWFFSLDAERTLAVLGARALKLPFFHCHAERRKKDGRHLYSYRRDWPQPARAHLDLVCEVAERLPAAQPEELLWFLTERYQLFSQDGQGGIRVVRVHHPPWSLLTARIIHLEQTLTGAAQLPELTRERPMAHYSQGVSTEIWLPEAASL